MYKIITHEFSYPKEFENSYGGKFERLEDACRWLGENIDVLTDQNPIESIEIKFIKE